MKQLLDKLLHLAAPKRKPAAEETGPRYADMQTRCLAAAVDLTLLFYIFNRPFDALSRNIYASIDPVFFEQITKTTELQPLLALLLESHFLTLWALNTLLQVIFIGLFYVGFQCIERTTPGKWLFGIRIVHATTLEQPARWRYLLRFLGYLLSAIPLMAGFVWMSFHKRHLAWHDMIAGTAVIHTRPRGWVWMQVKRAYHWLRGRMKRN